MIRTKVATWRFLELQMVRYVYAAHFSFDLTRDMITAVRMIRGAKH